MTYASLFTGAGGADIGLHRAGFTPLWFAEIDKFASSVLARHFPTIPNHGDITKLEPAKLEAPFLLWMSPPCQDLSVAGKRKGLSGERSGLFFNAIRIAENLVRRGTRIIAMEQVPGLLTSHGGDDFRAVLSAFLEIGARDVAWAVLDAQWFGVAQRRERMFFVADFGGTSASEILALADGLCGNPPPSRGEREGVAARVERTFGNNCIPEIAPALTSTSHHAPRPGAMSVVPCVGYTVPDVASTLGTPQGGANDLARLDAVIPIKDCASNMHGVVFQCVRRLTPREHERLQGWPDDWACSGVHGEISDTQRYKMIGNGVAATVSEWIGRQVKKHIPDSGEMVMEAD